MRHGRESGPVTADLTTTVVHTDRYKLLPNDVKTLHSLTNHNPQYVSMFQIMPLCIINRSIKLIYLKLNYVD